jgi:hypothetical protein
MVEFVVNAELGNSKVAAAAADICADFHFNWVKFTIYSNSNEIVLNFE